MGQPEDPLLAGVSDPLCIMGQPEDPLLAGVSDLLCTMVISLLAQTFAE